MSEGLTQSGFARWCACSRVAVHRAMKRGAIYVLPTGSIPPEHPINVEYRARALDRRVREIFAEGGELPAGWSCLAYRDPRRPQPIPLVFFPPFGDEEGVIVVAADFEADLEQTPAVVKIGGETFPAVLLCGPGPAPAWLET